MWGWAKKTWFYREKRASPKEEAVIVSQALAGYVYAQLTIPIYFTYSIDIDIGSRMSSCIKTIGHKQHLLTMFF